jgi:putative intracellular protease/amidase
MISDVVAVVGDRAAAFELGIACQVFGLDRSDDGLPCHDFAVCAPKPGPVPTTSGFTIDVWHGLQWMGGADLVIVPARPTLDGPVPPSLLDALRSASAGGARMLSICSGVFLLAAAGLLDGRRAAMHWQFADRLARRHPKITVDGDVLYHADGPVLTSAGAAADIDACLHLVRLEHGTATANALARRMVVAAHREGGQAQFIETPVTGSGPGYELSGAGLGASTSRRATHRGRARRSGDDVTAHLRPAVQGGHRHHTAPLAAGPAAPPRRTTAGEHRPAGGHGGRRQRLRQRRHPPPPFRRPPRHRPHDPPPHLPQPSPGTTTSGGKPGG